MFSKRFHKIHEQLVHIEDKNNEMIGILRDYLALDLRDRAIHIEDKINILIDAARSYEVIDHPDQMFGGRTFSQHGDDLIVACLFYSLGIEKPSYLDIGAHHPTIISNTALLYKRGCRGINVEPNPNLFTSFTTMRPDDINLNIGVADKSGKLFFYMIDDYSGRNTFDYETACRFCKDNPQFNIRETREIDVLTINDIVARYADGYPDFLSIDVEGLDESIIDSADFTKSKPKIICVEVINAMEDSSSMNRIRKKLEDRGYTSVIRAASNLILVENKYVHKVR